MRIIRLKANRSAKSPTSRGSFGYVYIYDRGELHLPVDLYNFFVINGVNTAVDLVVFIQNHPNMMCAVMGWSFGELKGAYLSLLGHLRGVLPEAVIRRPLTIKIID